MNSNRIIDDSKLLQLLAIGNEYAFTQIFDSYRDKIYSTAIKFLKSPLLAEEIVQDVFLKLWMRRAELGNVNNLEAFLMTVARNTIFDYFKRQAYENKYRQHLKGESSVVNNTDFLLRSHEYDRLLQEVIQQLPPQQRQVYRLAKEEGLTYEEIGEQMQVSKFTVKTHMAKALQTIRDFLQKNLMALMMFCLASIFFFC